MLEVIVIGGANADIKAKLHGAVVAALNAADVRPKLLEQGFEIVANTPEQFAAQIKAEYEVYKRVVQQQKLLAPLADLAPGLVEMHTDNLEKHFMPRPQVFWPNGVAAITFCAGTPLTWAVSRASSPGTSSGGRFQ